MMTSLSEYIYGGSYHAWFVLKGRRAEMWRVVVRKAACHPILGSSRGRLERSAGLRGGGRHGRHAPRDLRFRPDSGRAATMMVDDEGDFATVDMALPLHQRVAILRAEAPEVMTR